MSNYLIKSNNKYETALKLYHSEKSIYYCTVIYNIYYCTYLKICHILLEIGTKEFHFNNIGFKDEIKLIKVDDKIGGYHVWFANTANYYLCDYCYEKLDVTFDDNEFLNTMENLRNLRHNADYTSRITSDKDCKKSLEHFVKINEMLNIFS